jgi:hypothetical protein
MWIVRVQRVDLMNRCRSAGRLGLCLARDEALFSHVSSKAGDSLAKFRVIGAKKDK